jgi:type VII secretion-associated serine protease mycosin
LKLRLLTAAATAAAILFGPAAMAAAAVDLDHWQLAFLRAAEANAISQGEGVVIAVVDSGVDGTHPDLAGSFVPGFDFDAGSGNGQTDLDGHGTSMAGLIVAHGQMVGIAPKAKIMPLTAHFNTTGPKAIDWAVDHGAAVINISQSMEPSPALKAAVDRALAAGVVVVAAAGNVPADRSVIFPAAYDGVIAAGAVGRSGQLAAISVTGPQLVLAAPGEGLTSTVPSGAYGVGGNGTSGAAALISGVAALVKAKFPNLTGADITHRLIATADDKGAPGRDPEYGYGIVNPVAALTADIAPATASPSPNNPSGTGQALPGDQGSPLGLILAAAAVLVVGLVLILVVARRRSRR